MRYEVFNEENERLGEVAFEDDELNAAGIPDETLRARILSRFEELRITAGYESSPNDTQPRATLESVGLWEGLRFERLD